MPVTFAQIVGALASLATIQALVSLLLSERLKASLQREHAKFLEELRWDWKVREQAAKSAEYMALVWTLREDDSPETFRLANQLSWELALWLPSDVYRSVVQAIVRPDHSSNVLTAIIKVRALLLREAAGDLNADQIAIHAPGVGRAQRPSPDAHAV